MQSPIVPIEEFWLDNHYIPVTLHNYPPDKRLGIVITMMRLCKEDGKRKQINIEELAKRTSIESTLLEDFEKSAETPDENQLEKIIKGLDLERDDAEFLRKLRSPKTDEIKYTSEHTEKAVQIVVKNEGEKTIGYLLDGYWNMAYITPLFAAAIKTLVPYAQQPKTNDNVLQVVFDPFSWVYRAFGNSESWEEIARSQVRRIRFKSSSPMKRHHEPILKMINETATNPKYHRFTEFWTETPCGSMEPHSVVAQITVPNFGTVPLTIRIAPTMASNGIEYDLVLYSFEEELQSKIVEMLSQEIAKETKPEQ